MTNPNRTVSRIVALAAIALALMAQSVPSLDPPYTGAVTVSGKIAPGAGRVSIYDISYPAKTKLGDSQSVDASGNFAATVKPALIAGHQIIAIDANGVASAPVTVTNRPAGPAGPGN